MKRFLVFSYDTYYPCGGMGDFQDDFDTLEEATAFCLTLNDDWIQIYDCQTKQIVLEEKKKN